MNIADRRLELDRRIAEAEQIVSDLITLVLGMIDAFCDATKEQGLLLDQTEALLAMRLQRAFL